jgi:parallel beta-helix repeat protein
MSKISQYAAITSVQSDDELVVVDVHDTTMASSGTTKKMTISQLPSPTTTLAADTDVAITSPVNNQLLTYNSGTSKWVNQNSQNSQTLVTIGAATGTVNLNLASGSVFNVTLAGNTAFTFSGATAGTGSSFTLYLNQSSSSQYTVTWPTGTNGVIWIGGSQPSYTTATSSLNIFTFETINNGATWYGALASEAPAYPLTVASGGTGGAALGAYGVLTGGTSSTSPVQAVSGTGTTGQVLTSAGAGALPSWQNVTTVSVPSPAGVAATDTTAVTTAITALGTALASGPAVLMFQNGTYLVNSNSAVLQSLSNFRITSSGRTVIQQAPNTVSKPNNTTGNILTIADCHDFAVDNIVIDANRDVISPLVPLSASASSGQPSVTVALNAGANYRVGQALYIFGGVGQADSGQSEGLGVGAGTPLIISSITTAGGTAGGDLITFTTNLAHTWSTTGGAAVSDSYGPYAWSSDYLTPYQTATANSVAGRTLAGEDQQNGLHLLNCQRFAVSNVTARNTWESPIKLGTGERSGILSISDGCSQGTISDCTCYHGYDQGVSVWLSNYISVTGCNTDSPGWAGISLTASDHCTCTGNTLLNNVYQVPGDTSAGHGFTIEGGTRNQFSGNVVNNPHGHCVRTIISPLFFGLAGNTVITTNAFLEAGTAAGTSIQVSSTANLLAGGLYSFLDQERTEGIKIATIVDGTHITLTGPVQYSHAAAIIIVRRIAQENVISGNTLRNPQTGHCIDGIMGVRNVYKGNACSGWGTSSYGIAVFEASSPYLPSSSYTLGSPGCIIEGNVLENGGNCCINSNGSYGMTIKGNRMHGGALNTSNSAMDLKGIQDCLIEGNTITEVWGSFGMRIIVGGPGSVLPARNTVSGNRVERCQGAGILFQSADSQKITDNIVSSCGGNGGIDCQGISNSTIANNVSNSNHNAGIILENNGGVFSLNNSVYGNTCRDDGTGYNVQTGATWVQARGIYETGSSNFNLITLNEADTNGTAQIVTAGANSYAWNNNISGAVAVGVVPPQNYYAPAGLTGATAGGRYIGQTSTPGSAPVSGTFLTGDWVTDPSVPAIWVCNAGGTPGTWGEIFAGTGLTNPMTTLGDFLYGGASGTATRLAGNTSATQKVLTQTGNGTISAAPVWQALAVTTNYTGVLGDGSDSSVTLDGTTTFNSWSALAGSVYTMSRDVFCTALTINTGVTLKTNGWRVFVTGTLANAGTISSNGGSAAVSTAGAIPYSSANCMYAGSAGATGVTGVGAQGSNSGSGMGTGTGSAGGSGTSGAGGSARAFRTAVTSMFRVVNPALTATTSFANAAIQVGGGYGGGSGAGDGTNAGGAGGGGGGFIALFANAITNTGTISAAGGAGGTPATGNCGGGGGGGGGFILAYTLSAWTAGTTSVAGGTNGSGIGSGTAGTAGTAGTVLNVVLQ